jgi:septal ring factor EnvC (AmiA/AmiB activator)
METGVVLFLAAQLVAGILGFVKIYTHFTVQIAQLLKDRDHDLERFKQLTDQQKDFEKKMNELDNKIFRKLDDIASQIQKLALELNNKQNRPN